VDHLKFQVKKCPGLFFWLFIYLFLLPVSASKVDPFKYGGTLVTDTDKHIITAARPGRVPRSGSRINIPDHIYDPLETNFYVKIFKYFEAVPDPRPGTLFDTGSGMEKIRIRDPK
jgi:hypothetical protein